jgi:Aspartyl/Asparaginyl beta-hydroxylase
MTKIIFKREDFPKDAEYMMSLADRLRDEYINYNIKVIQQDPSKEKLVGENTYQGNIDHLLDRPGTWKSISLKYRHENMVIDADEELRRYLPTAVALTEYYGDDCPLSNYSTIEPDTIIHRHTGIENRSGEYIRVHIPLIIPEGDVFFEAAGQVVRWDDIFAFDNQKVHSAWNCTDKRRAVFIIDVRRKRLGLPPGQPYDAMRDEVTVTPFIYKGKFA